MTPTQVCVVHLRFLMICTLTSLLVLLATSVAATSIAPRTEEKQAISARQHFLSAQIDHEPEEEVNSGTRMVTPAYLELLYQFVTTELEGHDLGRNTRGVLAKAFLPDAVTEDRPNRISLIFNYSDHQLQDATSAELIFTMRRNVDCNVSEINVHLERGDMPVVMYDGVFPADNDKEIGEDRHVPFDVSSAVHRYESLEDSFVFNLEVKGHKHLSVSDILDLDTTSQQPLLVGYYVATKMPLGTAVSHWRRQRRSVPLQELENEEEDSTSTVTPDSEVEEESLGSPGPKDYCEHRKWMVPTKALRFPWILLPDRLAPNYCMGTCPSPLHHSYYNSTTNTLIRDRIRTIHSGLLSSSSSRMSVIPESHCVPIEFAPTTLLMEEKEGYFRLDIVHDLIVSRCGCR